MMSTVKATEKAVSALQTRYMMVLSGIGVLFVALVLLYLGGKLDFTHNAWLLMRVLVVVFFVIVCFVFVKYIRAKAELERGTPRRR